MIRESIRLGGIHWIRDLNARTLSYYNSEAAAHVHAGLLEELIQVHRESGSRGARLCLHSSMDQPHHDMIVLLPKGSEVNPHFHPYKDETLHVIRGTLGLIHYNKEGQVMSRFVLSSGDLFRIPANHIHWTIPLTEFVIFHESAPGPYDKNTNAFQPSWVPKEEDREACRRWLDTAHKLFEEQPS